MGRGGPGKYEDGAGRQKTGNEAMADDPRRIIVTDVKIPFWSLVVLLVKVAIAAIPALMILAGLWLAVVFAFVALTGWHGPY